MTPKYTTPSVDAILEDAEDGSQEALKGREDESPDESSYRQLRLSHDSAMRASNGRERDRPRRHKSSYGGKHTSKPRSKYTGGRRSSGITEREDGYDAPRTRHRRTLSNQSTSSTSTSSSDEDEPTQDHREVLAARSRLNSPSTISTLTSLTTTTNKSSGSSGSNSTVTQASITKKSVIVNKPEVESDASDNETPMSPAVPDPPNVFAFLDKDGSPEPDDEDDEDVEGEEEQDEDEDEDEDEGQEDTRGPTSQWTPTLIEGPPRDSELPSSTSPETNSASSSTSSSFHGDDFSEPQADNDTDRSSSPERSVKDNNEAPEVPPPPPTDRVSAKIASQMAAAQQRQNLYGSMQQFGTPNMPRGNSNLPFIPPTALTTRYQHHIKQHPLPRAEKIPVTGYELLASRLSSSAESEKGARIKPIYRKFEALNHRLLLHLQDEISELEEQLHRLDNADTQSRRTDRFIVPASRRAAAQAGGELQWHKTDILGRIGFKLSQYNAALSSFNSTQSLNPPAPDDIEQYREYLQTERPIADAETHFLDPADDLVSISSENIPRPTYRHSSGIPSSSTSISMTSSSDVEMSSDGAIPSPEPQPKTALEMEPSPLPGLAMAIAVAVLLPVLTFPVIPGFIGRLTVTTLVALGVLATLMQSGSLRQEILFGRESCICAGVYGGVMIVLAGIVA